MRKFLPLLALLITLSGVNTIAQEKATFKKQRLSGKLLGTFDPSGVEPSTDARIIHLEAPRPDGKSARSHAMRVKTESRKLYPIREGRAKTGQSDVPPPQILDGYSTQVYIADRDQIIQVGGGNPLDNTMAISNDGYLMSSVNSTIYMQDVSQSTDVKVTQPVNIRFDKFAEDFTLSSPFDPKLLYDVEADRFVVTFLTGREPGNSGIVMGFSSTNDPLDEWNLYLLDGNPLKNNTWTDYPAMALTKDELFLTVNLLFPDSSWQTGFNGSIIWQMDKFSGYAGDSILTTNLWSDIRYDGKFVRNLNPIEGAYELPGPNMYCLSNRNFDISNDSIFIVETTGTISDPSSTLKVSMVKADTPYGMPPNGRQEDTNPNDPTEGFDTNDGRILGGFLRGNTIQFVSNTMNFETGLAGIYHGVIDDITGNPKITGHIIGHDSIDYGYPNIAFTGDEDCDDEAIIAFDHTSPTVFAGNSAVYFSNDREYSDPVMIHEGEAYVDKIPGGYERWGDYFGIQRVYNEPGTVWTSGLVGYGNNTSTTWISKLATPDAHNPMSLTVDSTIADANACFGTLTARVSNGQAPYDYLWNQSAVDSFLRVNLCDFEYELVVNDQRGCQLMAKGAYAIDAPESEVFPNPTAGIVNFYFTLPQRQRVTAQLYSIDGTLVDELVDQEAAEGKNVLEFSLEYQAAGVYVLKVTTEGEILYEGEVVKAP